MTKDMIQLKTIMVIGLVGLGLGYWMGSRGAQQTIKESRIEINSCWDQFDDLKTQCEAPIKPDRAEKAVKSNVDVTVPTVVESASIAVSASKEILKDKKLWVKLGPKAADIGYEPDIKEFLKQVEVPDFFNELKSSTPLSDGQLDSINGHFLGSIAFDDSTKESWQIEMDVNGQLREGEVKGSQLIILSKNGKVISRTTGRGRIKDITAFSGDPNSIIINAYGDDGYVQLYYFPKLNLFSGLYYGRESVGDFRKVGTVTLAKR